MPNVVRKSLSLKEINNNPSTLLFSNEEAYWPKSNTSVNHSATW
jgi:hypothetical protein